MESGAGETEIGELAFHGCCETIGGRPACGGQFFGYCGGEIGPFGDFAVEIGEGLIAAFEGFETRLGLFEEFEDIRDGPAVFVAQGFHETDSRFEFLEVFGRAVEFGEGGGDFARKIVDGIGAGAELIEPFGGLRAVEVSHFFQGADGGGEEIDGVHFAFGEGLGGDRAEFEDACGVGGGAVFGEERLAVGFGIEVCVFDFPHLVAQQIEFARDGFGIVAEQFFPACFEFPDGGPFCGVFLADGLAVSEGIESHELKGRIEKRLVVVRAVEIDEMDPDTAQCLDGGGASVDGASAAAVCGDGAMQQQDAVFAGIDTGLFEERRDESQDGLGQFEGCAHLRLSGVGAHLRAIRAAAGQ